MKSGNGILGTPQETLLCAQNLGNLHDITKWWWFTTARRAGGSNYRITASGPEMMALTERIRHVSLIFMSPTHKNAIQRRFPNLGAAAVAGDTHAHFSHSHSVFVIKHPTPQNQRDQTVPSNPINTKYPPFLRQQPE